MSSDGNLPLPTLVPLTASQALAPATEGTLLFLCQAYHAYL